MKSDDDWQAEMTARYPLTLGNVSLGFCVGPGWRGIVERLCEKLEPYIAGTYSAEDRQSLGAVQIKEKFGGLRFYTGTITEQTEIWIREAEDESFRTCDRCGDPGKCRRIGQWLIATRCEAHSK